MKKEKSKRSLEMYYHLNDHFKWLLLAIITIAITIILYPGLLVTQHSYTLGDVVEKDLKAPKDFLIEDRDSTTLNRARAVESVLTVYDHDTTLQTNLVQNVNDAFGTMRQIIQQVSEEENTATDTAEGAAADTPGTTISKDSPEKTKQTIQEAIWDKKSDMEKKLGVSLSNGAFKILENEDFSSEIASLITKILSEILENGVVANKEILLKESEKGIVLRQIEQKTETRILNLRQYYGLDQSKVMVRVIGQPILQDINYNLRNLIVDIVQRLLQPNITLNKHETEQRKKRAAAEIKPIFHKIKAGEMLMREGERITDIHLLKLKALETQFKDNRIVAKSIGTSAIIMCLLIVMYILYTPHLGRLPGSPQKNLLFITSVFMFFVGMAELSTVLSESLSAGATISITPKTIYYGVPIAAGAMTACLFLGLQIAIAFAVLTAICSTVIYSTGFEVFIYLLLNGCMAAYWVQECRERKVFINAGLKLGLLNIVLAVVAEIYAGNMSAYRLAWDAGFAFVGGVAAGIVTAGLAPLIELTFGYTTDISLLELANLDRPILKRLMIEAPGTYHHSMVVGTMVEAAASEIGANPLLAKVCGYYHDIGKIKKPLYFVENQEDGINRHDKLAPSMSSLILIAHVKNGMEIARKNKLGQQIIDTIEQHHGTSLIQYFYDKAKKLRGADRVKIDDFRYPGPRPQTREAGLVMLADVLEAASRTLANPTPARIQRLVQELVNKIFSDGQLDNCELTLKDLHNIARNFNKILTGIHHHRVEYAETAALTGGNRKNGRPDRQPTKQIQDISKKSEKENKGHLRRLGLS